MISSDRTFSSEKKDTKITEVGWVVFIANCKLQKICSYAFLGHPGPVS